MDNIRQRIEKESAMIYTIAEDTRIDYVLLAAICWQESEFNMFSFRFEPAYYAKYIEKLSSKKLKLLNPWMEKTGVPSEQTEKTALSTSWGMMQIMGQTARELGFRGQYLTELCGQAGVQYGALNLRKQLDRYNGNVEQAISAYNAGSKTTKNKSTYVTPVLEKMKTIHDEKLLT